MIEMANYRHLTSKMYASAEESKREGVLPPTAAIFFTHHLGGHHLGRQFAETADRALAYAAQEPAPKEDRFIH